MEARYLTDLEWRICHAVNIYVFRNGKDGEQPVLVHIPPSKKKNMRTVMSVVQDRVKYPVGYAKYLFKMDGTRIKDPCELEMYNNYVVSSNFEKHFKCAQYGRRRSPLLVLNRDSKHVRVLKLQNQNYYEWLLKKKAVGEERPAYIYPPYYTNENKLPQDLPLGQMGNYNPGEQHAPGCCYPKPDGGNKTYRMDSQYPQSRDYTMNALTVDIPPPDLSNIPFSTHFSLHRKPKNVKVGSNIMEPTPSDMLNANVLVSDGASPDAVTVSTTSIETDDQGRKGKHSKHKGVRGQKGVREVSSEGFDKQTKRGGVKQTASVTETTTVCTQSSEDMIGRSHHNNHSGRHHHKGSKHGRTMKMKDINQQLGEFSMDFASLPPPPPSQFRDNAGREENTQLRVIPPPTQFAGSQENLEGIAAGHAQQSPKPFYYSPEKLAEISSFGTIEPFELTYSQSPAGAVLQPGSPHIMQQQQQQPPGFPVQQWAIVQQPPQLQQQQTFQQVYAIESQPGGPGTPKTTTLIPAQAIDPNQGGVFQVPIQPQVMQSFALPQHHQQGGQGGMIPSQNTLIHHQPNQHQQVTPLQQPPTQCIVFPNQRLGPSSSSLGHGTTQLIAVPNSSSHNQMQQVYQLGIVQQPNPQTCIQVDAKAMRQYVDNQKLIECRFKQQQQFYHHQPEMVDPFPNQGKTKHHHRSKHSRKNRGANEMTESELDIPFTPMKTYRLENQPNVEQSRSPVGQRHSRLPKVKSRNVAIQMGYPASARSNIALNELLEDVRSRNVFGGGGGVGGKLSRASDMSIFLHSPRRSINDSCRSRSDNLMNKGPSLNNLMRTPKAEGENFFTRISGGGGGGCGERSLRRSGNILASHSDHYFGKDASSSNPFRRRRSPGEGPVIEDLVTIPPPTEFRGFPLHSTRHQHDHQLDNSNVRRSKDNFSRTSHNNNHVPFGSNNFTTGNSPEHCMYPNRNNNNDRSQYMYSQYP